MKKSSKSINNSFAAIKFCFKYINYFKYSFLFAVFYGVASTIVNVLIILGMGTLTNKLGDFLMPNNSNVTLDNIIILCAILIALFLIYSLLAFSMHFILAAVSQRIGHKIRMDLFNKIQLIKVQFFDVNESGDTMSILTNDIFNLVIFFAQNFGNLVFNCSMIVSMLILMFVLSPYLTLIAIGIIGIILIYIIYLSHKSTKPFLEQQIKIGHMNGYIEEAISGQNVINLNRYENQIYEKFNEINDDLSISSQKAQTISGLMIPFMNFTLNFSCMIMTMIAIIFATNGISFGSNIFNGIYNYGNTDVVKTIALINSFILALRNFVNPVNVLVGMIVPLQQAFVGTRRVNNILLLDNEDNKEETINIESLKGKIKFKDINFSYFNDENYVLKNLSFNVKPKETIAIVGPTGSGKTTIINLLTKFYDIKDGDIIFDDKYSIHNFTKSSLRNNVSIVLQDPYLFNDTIKENIRYANREATDDEIYDVAKNAYCDDFIHQLPYGYETELNENASELSQGQKQLISIARAMLSKSSILILDEATSSIDSRTEQIVVKAMQKLIKQKTSFIIAHKLSTIQNADKILVLNKGEIIEFGNHNELLSKKGFYYNLYQARNESVDFCE